MRDEETGEYLGCLEVSQDITSIQNLVGEKRLDGHEKTTSEYENQVAKSIKSLLTELSEGKCLILLRRC